MDINLSFNWGGYCIGRGSRGTSERDLAEQEKIFDNFEKLKNQIQKIFPYEIVNNYDWTKNIMAIDFLREFGKHITAGICLIKN